MQKKNWHYPQEKQILNRGQTKPKKPRPIHIKFLSHKTKARVVMAKKAMKGSEFWLTDLPSENPEKSKITEWYKESYDKKRLNNRWEDKGT